VHHDRAVREIKRRLASGESLIVAAPTLVEAYSVLTRLPQPTRLSPAAALSVLSSSFQNETTAVVALRPEAYRALLNSAPGRNVAGGRIYDEVILACAASADVDVLLTFNARHFRSIAGDSIKVVVPD
jgi:predicted nucleic acid-binding protein